jgi:hypothetical protein
MKPYQFYCPVKSTFFLTQPVVCIHTTRDYRQYSPAANLHTFQFIAAHALGFSIFSSRILATELQQYHCHFTSHIKTSFHCLISFLQLFSTQFSFSASKLIPRQARVSKLDSSLHCCQLRNSSLLPLYTEQAENTVFCCLALF